MKKHIWHLMVWGTTAACMPFAANADLLDLNGEDARRVSEMLGR